MPKNTFKLEIVTPFNNRTNLPGKYNEIWIVDDDQLTIFIAKKMVLTAYPDVKVQSFLNGELALEALKSEVLPEVILLDINMPVCNGWQFLDQIATFASLPDIFMFTSSIDINDFDKARSYSYVKGFISKPLTIDKLKKTLG